MNPNDFFFIHETALWDEFVPNKMTKVELGVLHDIPGIEIIQNEIGTLPPISLTEIYACARKENAQHLIAQLKKLSTDKQTEIAKGFFRYNNGIYFYRIYKLVGNDYAKTELTKVPLGQRAWLHPITTVNGLTDAMKRITRRAESHLLPHYKHIGTYETLDDFKKKFL